MSLDLDIVKWICSELTVLLDMPTSEDIAEYILSIDSSVDLESYITDLLDPSIARNRQFLQDLLGKWAAMRAPKNAYQMQAYRKPDKENCYVRGRNENETGRKKDVELERNASSVPKSSPPANGATKKKMQPKFVSLFSDDAATKSAAKLPGRHVCECQASKHSLVNNCVRCGRVVCVQEGSGPCVFCGTLVCSKAEQETLDRGSKRSDKLRDQLMQKGRTAADVTPQLAAAAAADGKLQVALASKDRLLEYDQTSAKRTQVIDDESDYFATDTGTWLNSSEKAALQRREDELRARRFASRRDRKVVLDFAGRRVVDDGEAVSVYDRDDAVVKSVQDGGRGVEVTGSTTAARHDGSIVNPDIKQDPPQFVAVDDASATRLTPLGVGLGVRGAHAPRLQDRQLQEMSDGGMCLSMHQPWASLLIKGIKVHEGRTWYSAHRGRLWIAATKQCADAQEIVDLEQHYRMIHKDDNLPFPDAYPVSCLLGCVNVTDCLEEQQYQQQFPDGDSDSPYVFICEEPEELIVKFPIRGKHKIYKLPSHVHHAAKKGLRGALMAG